MAVGPVAERGIPEALRVVARAALAADGNVRAVLLYGSRARGDHGPRSDWDIALVTRRGGWRLCHRRPAGWRNADEFETPFFLRLSEAELRAKRDATGHPAFALARDGVLLAGSWRRPVPGRPLPVAPDDYARILEIALYCFTQAVYDAGRLLTDPVDPVYRRFRSAELFDRDRYRLSWLTGLAASGLAVAVLARFAMPGTRKQPPERLARAIPDPALAAALAGLGGPVARENDRGDAVVLPGDLKAAFVRIARIAARLPDELLEAARAPQLGRMAPGFALRQVRELRWMAADLRKARQTAGDPLRPDFPVSAQALEDHDRMAPALDEAARGLMAIPRILKQETAGPVAQWQSDGLSSRRETAPDPDPGVRVRAGPPHMEPCP